MLTDSPDEYSPEEGGKALEQQVAKVAEGFRASFGKNRRDYNFAVCDALAGAGITPTSAAVLRVGRWGQNASVAEDVRQWNRALASRLQRIEASIPLAAKRQAGELFEQLFALASRTAQAQADERLVPLQAELAQAQDAQRRATEALGQVTAQAEQGRQDAQALLAEQGRLRAELQNAQDALEESRAEQRTQAAQALALAQQVRAAEQALQDASHQHERLRAQDRQELLGAREAATRELLAAQQGFDAERKRLMLSLDHERVEHAAQLKALQADAQAAQARIEALRAEGAQLAVAHASATASLGGAQALLGAERARFAQAEEHLRSPAWRHRSLLAFVEQARAGGVLLARQAEPQALGQWLEGALALEPEIAARVLGALPAHAQPTMAQAPETPAKRSPRKNTPA